MKIGIYGGSFNPVHFGHLGLAQYVLKHSDLDEVWMLVTPNNPLKDSGILVDENIRLTALREAIDHLSLNGATLNGEAAKQGASPLNSAALNAEGSKRLLASDFEFSLPRPSYTANTLRELQKAYPEHEFSLIIGEDNWLLFDRWRESDYILSHFRIFVYPRHSIDASEGKDISTPDNVVFLHGAPYFDISSTELRNASRTSCTSCTSRTSL